MKLYIIRHGQTDWNKIRKMQGHSDIPLNDYGRELAKVTADGLSEVSFDLAYTSPLIRAKETAEIILDGREVPLIEDERIKEIGFGVCEGMEFDREMDTGIGAELVKFFDEPASYQPPKGAESIESLMERTDTFLKELYHNDALQNSNILLSTHGAALRGLLASIKGLPIEELWQGGVQKNCAVSIIEVRNQTPKIIDEGIVYYK